MALTILKPRTLDEAAGLLADGAQAISGGTLMQLAWLRGEAQPERLVDLGKLTRDDINEADGVVTIGAGTRLADLETSDLIARRLPLLVQAARSIAAPGVRRLGTVGGNVAGRIGCLWPALLALDARVTVFADGRETERPLLDWLALPSATILTAIRIPVPAGEIRTAYRKIGLRAAFTPSIIGAAGLLEIEDGHVRSARLAVGAGITRPQRLARSEALLTNRDLGAIDWSALRESLIDEIETTSDAYRSARYRKQAAANALVAGLGGGVAVSRRSSPRHLAPAEPIQPDESIEVSHAKLASRWGVRPDIAAKVAGTLEYLTDHRAPGMLIGRILRAGIPHANIRAIDTSAAEALPGVVAVVTAADIRGENAFGIMAADQPALCFDKVRHMSDPVAAVAAIDAETAARALSLIRVDYEPLPLVEDWEAALADGAPLVHASGNLRAEFRHERGDIEAAFARATHIVEDVYVTPRQMHGFMETEGGYIVPEADGSLTVCVGGQHGTRDRKQLSLILGLPEEKIRVVTSPTGGAFGGKDELHVQPALALLALKAGRPVRLQLDRYESVIASVKRNPMRIRMRTACDAEGRLIAQDVDVIADSGAYASLSPAVLETALEHVAGPYRIGNIRSRGRLAFTNNGICGAFRGFGANQMVFAIESQVSRLAELVGLDPVAIRRLNLRIPGEPGFFGHEVAPTERLSEMLDAASANPLWRTERGLDAEGRLVGVGMALHHQGTGLGSLPHDPGGGRLTFRADGKIEAAYGLDEMGQGVMPAIQAAVSQALGCAREDIVPVIGDTGRTPESGSTTAARGTYVIWRTARDTAPGLSLKLREAAARLLDLRANDLAIAPGGIRDARSNSGALLLRFADLAARLDLDAMPSESTDFHFPKADYTEGNSRYVFCFGAAVVRVAVDPVSGQVQVLDLDQHIAAGPIVDPAAYLGQIEGGGGQGLGFTLTEDAIMQGGAFVTRNFDTYMMPSIADAPLASRITALESLDADDPHGPRGVGEIGIGAVTPAIAAAIADATGFWPVVTPIAPEAILDALAGANHVA
ncbi:molybdopterin-dependent oxidoreductase [Kaistia dalseonensis]|uniref:Xanthine dehydrogenase D subunit n=1 Tax=Kaistia dalseonensis TaxID=410840 RepID=A0ABU0H9R3_9HYPH|nr:molybdopterin cofactor-binding domain-containing protein [Kaistia dalseonensis]MCX5496399.1 molybdopterin-dependent oxidoreductase [Kaistia dalseonensis]MDQ0439020.1 xanthine dehydrogenase D subunit [Kaistia dalseonensis]